MQTLGEALARVRPQRADHPEDLERLVTLEPTVILERRLAIARQQLGAELARLDPELELDQAARPPQAIRRADDRVARALADVKLGRRRDLLALAFGCWCLGIGGRELRPAWREGLGFLDVDGAPVEVCAKYCDCPVGARLEAEHAAALDLALRQAEAARHGRIWRSVPRELRDVTLDSYPGEDPSQVRALGLVRKWAAARSPWMLLDGPPGVGKTGLAIAGARETGANWAYVFVPDLLGRLRATFDQDHATRNLVSEADVLGNVYGVELLILDDLGVQRSTEWTDLVVYQVVYHREAEGRRTIITTNQDPAAADAHLGEQGARVMSRVLGACGLFAVHIDGPDLRRRPGTRA